MIHPINKLIHPIKRNKREQGRLGWRRLTTKEAKMDMRGKRLSAMIVMMVSKDDPFF